MHSRSNLVSVPELQCGVGGGEDVHEDAIDPFGGEVPDRVAQAVLPPVGNRGEVVFAVAVFGYLIGILRVDGHVNGVIDVGGADSRRIEGEAAYLQGKPQTV